MRPKLEALEPGGIVVQEEVPPPEVPAGKGPKAVARARRRRSAARNWRTFKKSKMGMTGLYILLFFMAVAVFAPLISSSKGLNAVYATGTPFSGPSFRYPFGTDDVGRSILTE